MAEGNNDDQEKNEEPSEQKLRKAREEGNVPRSKELNTAVLLLLAGGGLFTIGPFIAAALAEVAVNSWTFDHHQATDTDWMAISLYSAFIKEAGILLPFFMILFFASILGSIGLGGFNYSPKALAPKANRISPLAGLKRMFSMNSLVELGKGWLKVLLLGGVGITVLLSFSPSFMQLGPTNVEYASRQGINLILTGFLILAAVTGLIALLDVPWQIFSHTKKLRMSRQEQKDEYKNTEGKPEVKGRIRQLQREISQRRQMAKVPEADVVITNPEHYSVALKYDQNAMAAPVVLAKGADEMALKIREIAKEHRVPMVQAPPLARSLFQFAKVDEPIPEGLYMAVAQILAYVWQLEQYQKGRQPKPRKPSDMPIPDDLRFDPDANA